MYACFAEDVDLGENYEVTYLSQMLCNGILLTIARPIYVN
jgi:hypothetical protein